MAHDLLTLVHSVYVSPGAPSRAVMAGARTTLVADGVYNCDSIYSRAGLDATGIDLVTSEFVDAGLIGADGGDTYARAIGLGVDIGVRDGAIRAAGALGAAAAARLSATASIAAAAPPLIDSGDFAFVGNRGESDAGGAGRYGVDLTQGAPSSDGAQPGSSNFAASAIDDAEAMTVATSATLSGAQLLDFSTKNAVGLGGGFSYSLPKDMYHKIYYGYKLSGGGGFSLGAYISAMGGIKGGVSAQAGSILPNFPLDMNPEVLSYVQQGQTFSVDPTLISTEDAGFSLNLPSATANLTFGLQASVGVSIGLPSVTIGWSPFSYTFDGPTFGPYKETGGKLVSLPTSGTKFFPGGYFSLSELDPAKVQSTLVSQTSASLPTITETFDTAPFLKGSFDAIAAIAQYVPELQVVDGGYDFGIGSVNWSLLSLPLSASLYLADTITTSEAGFTANLTETVGGKTISLGPQASTQAIGDQWTIVAPSHTGSGDGVIALKEEYALTLNVESVLSLNGSFDLTLVGPQASGSIFGYSYSTGALFTIPIYSKSGDIATISTTTSKVTLTASQRELVFYGKDASAVTLTQSQTTFFDLGASGELLTINSTVSIAPSAGSGTATVGVQATLGADGVYNHGSVYAQPGAGSVGINLAKGGKLVNSGVINAKGDGGHYAGEIQYGVRIGGHYSTVSNTGTIGGVDTGVAAVSGSEDDTLYLYNNGGGVISASQAGLTSNAALIRLHNDGKIGASSGVGVQGGAAGLFLYNYATGVITGGQASVESQGFGSVENQGQIGTGAPGQYGVNLTQGNLFNFGTIAGASIGAQVGSQNLPTSVIYNAGLIEATNSDAYAVKMMGPTNTLLLKPGSSFVGAVYATSSATSNVVELLAGAGMGTFVAGPNVINFDEIDIASSASWLLRGGSSGFGDDTISGLSSLDLISFSGQAFQYGDSVSLSNQTDVLSLINPGGTTIATADLASDLAGARFNLFGTPSETYIREFTGAHYSDVINRAAPSQIIDANSYFGQTTSGMGVTVTQNSVVQYDAAAYPNRGFALDLKAVTVATTVTTGGVTSVSKMVQPAILHNDGYINGADQGVLLQTPATIFNRFLIRATGTGILQAAGSSYAKIVNYGGVYGQTGIILDFGGVVDNSTSGSVIGGTSDGVIAVRDSTIQNAGSVTGASGVGILLGHDADVFNASTGTITGGVDGVSATGAAVAVTNAGSIGGPIGVSLASGGSVSNVFNKVDGVPVWGTISGGRYAVVVSGKAAVVTNGYGTIGGAASPALIEGVWLLAGGNIVNGRYGVIKGSGAYGVLLGPAVGATISNAGEIGAIHARRGDLIGNKAGGTIQSVSGLGGASKGPLSIKNAGVIGAGASGAGISAEVATYLYNSGTVENGIQFAEGGTIVDAGAIYGAGGGNAITFGTVAATLVLEGANLEFSGNIVGDAVDTLKFANSGTLVGGVGVEIAGFGDSVVEAGTNWTFGGQNTLTGKWTIAGTVDTSNDQGNGLTVAGSVAVTGEVQGVGGSFYPAADGLYVMSSGTVSNSGLILGGHGSSDVNAADGVDIAGRAVTNSGSIAGGNYAVAGEFSPTYGGDGVSLASGVLINSGGIAGGASQRGASLAFPDGVGVYIAGGTVVTSGTISGGSGADAMTFANSGGRLVLDPGAVFNGVVAGVGNTLELSGTGNGVLSGLGSEFTGFAQVTEDADSRWMLTGANTVANAITLVSGAVLTVNGSLTNSGGGAAVDLDGGLLVNAGKLAGGAVKFGAVRSTLAITPTASFSGAVAAASGEGDMLLLLGAGGKLSGLGTEFANFGALAVAASASWTMAGSSSFDGALAVSGTLALASGTQTIEGVLSGKGALQLGSGSLLDLAGTGAITQSVSGAGTVEVKGDLALATSALDAAKLEIAVGGTLAGTGAIGASVVDSGSLSASLSVLDVKGAISGAGILAAAKGGELVLGGGGSFGGALAGAGTIDFAAPLTLTSGAHLGVSTLLDTANLTLGTGESLTNAAGDVFDIKAAGSTSLTVGGAGAHGISNAGTLVANGLGVATMQASLVNSGHLGVSGGTLVIAGEVTNSGAIVDSSGLLSMRESVEGDGAMAVDATGTLSLGGAVGAEQTVNLTHAGSLDLGDPGGFLGAIADFSGSAGIDLLSTPETSYSYANDILTLKDGASVVGALHFTGNYTIANFTVGTDHHSGTLISWKA